MTPSITSIMFGRTKIDYRVITSSRRKSLSIQVGAVAGVEVHVPESYDREKLPSIVHKKAPWILEKLRLIEDQVVAPTHEFVSGERFLYLGRRYRLHVRRHNRLKRAKISFLNGAFHALIPSHVKELDQSEHLRPLFVQWYRAKAEERLFARVGHYAPLLGVKPKTVKVTDLQSKRWGSCDSNGVLRFNWRIIMAKATALDYVVAHELIHMRIKDHSDAFWRLVGSVLHDYEERRDWLRRHGPELDLQVKK